MQDTTNVGAAEQPQAVQPSTKEEGITDKDLLKMVDNIDGLPSDTNEIIKT